MIIPIIKYAQDDFYKYSSNFLTAAETLLYGWTYDAVVFCII